MASVMRGRFEESLSHLFSKSKRLNNLCALVDFNKWQATQKTINNYSIENLNKKFKSFGWNSKIIKGHNHSDIFKKFRLL